MNISASPIKGISVLVGAHRTEANNMESENLHHIPRFQNDVPEPTKHVENILAVATSASRNVLSLISSSPASDPCSGLNCREADNCLLQQANGRVRGAANTLHASPQNQVDMPTETFAAEKVATKTPSTPSNLKEIEQLATRHNTNLEDEEDLTWRKFVFGSPESERASSPKPLSYRATQGSAERLVPFNSAAFSPLGIAASSAFDVPDVPSKGSSSKRRQPSKEPKSMLVLDAKSRGGNILGKRWIKRHSSK
jgi:hypothetical protein